MLNCAFLTQIMTKRYRPWSNKRYSHKVKKNRYPKSVKILILSRTSFLAELWADCPILSGVFLYTLIHVCTYIDTCMYIHVL